MEELENLFSRLLILPLIISSIFLGGCGREAQSPPRVRFEPMGIRVCGLDRPASIRLLDDEGKLLLSYPELGSEAFLFFDWHPSSTYTIEAGRISIKAKAPEVRPFLELRVSAPLGQPPQVFFIPGGPVRDIPFELTGESGSIDVGILLRSHTDREIEFSLRGSRHLLSQAFDTYSQTIHLDLENPDQRLDLPLKILSPRTQELNLSFRFHKTDLKGMVELVSWQVPTDAFGSTEAKRLQDTIVLPAPLWERIGYALGLRASGRSKFDPTTFQSLTLKSRLGSHLTVLITSDFFYPGTEKQVEGFYPKEFGPTGGTKKVIAFVDIPAGGKAKAVLPIYIDPAVNPGAYLQRVTVTPLGSRDPVFTAEKELGLMRGSSFFTAALLVIIAVALGYCTFVALRFKHLLSGFNVQALVLIALMGAVGFGLDFLGGMAANVLNAVLGPFNILVGGLITEVTHYLVLTAVLFLIPQWGTVTLSGIVTYLMSGMITGGFGILDILFVGSRLAYAEGMLYLFGITSSGRIEGRELRLAIALSLADALTTGTSLVLHSTFYRLFFPLWYVALAVAIKGFAYTFIGVRIGLPFGRTLKSMER